MATKVFLKCVAVGPYGGFTVGKEYPVTDIGTFSSDNGVDGFSEDGLSFSRNKFQRIERQTFEAHGFVWFKHTPGEPMPCDDEANVQTICQSEIDGFPRMNERLASSWSWGKLSSVIGWRFADSEQKEPTIAFSQAQDGTNWNAADFGVVPDDESERNDLIAAVDDGHLTPGQKAYIQDKEDAQAAKQQLKHDAEAKALQERADQLADAGKAMDRVNQDHGHRLGWMQ